MGTNATSEVDLIGILNQSRHNNAIDGISGLLWFDTARFIQVIEGPEASVGATFARIAADPRHRDIVAHLDRMVDARQFGTWTMRYRNPADPADRYDAELRRLLSRAAPDVIAPFLTMIAQEEGGA